MPVDSGFNKLHCSDLFHPAVAVKSGMQHFTFAEIHGHMEDLPVTKKGDHIAELGVERINFIKAGSFFLITILNAEIRIVIKHYA